MEIECQANIELEILKALQEDIAKFITEIYGGKKYWV
jgi:hypothetical protein